MEVVFKTLHFLCLSSVTVGLQIAPSLDVKTPINLELGIGGINTNLVNNINSKSHSPISHKQCFCLPHNANSQPVISYLDPTKNNLERRVVYLYKNDDVMKAYIPNKNKQDLIPELNFENKEGDILEEISSESIADLFDMNTVKTQQTVEALAEEISSESETTHVDTDRPQPLNMNIDSREQFIPDSDYSSVIPTDINNSLEDDKSFVEENVSLDNIIFKPNSQSQSESINDPESNKITFLDDDEDNGSHNLFSMLPLIPQVISNQITTDNNDDLENVDQPHHIASMLPSKPKAISGEMAAINNDQNPITILEEVDQLHHVASVLPSNPHVMDSQIPTVNNDHNQNTNFDDIEQLHQIASMLPSDPQKISSQVIAVNNYQNQVTNLEDVDELYHITSSSPSETQATVSQSMPVNNDKNQITNLEDVDQLDHIASMLPSKLQTEISQDVRVDSHEVHINPGLDDPDQLHVVTLILPPESNRQPSSSHSEGNKPTSNKSQNLDNSGQSHPILSTSPAKSHSKVFKNPDRFGKNKNIADNDQLQVIFPFLPPESQSHPEAHSHQNLFHIDPMGSPLDYSYVTFYDWFKDQLTRVVLYNLDTPSKIIELRKRVKKVLEDNGMHIGTTGIVIDTNDNLVRMNSIKLRPILIGSQVDSENLVNHPINLLKTAVSYTQLIEIILIDPPRLLGTLMMGTVYLPRNVNGPKATLPNKHQDKNIVPAKRPVSCITCNPKYSYPYSLINGLQYSPINVPYGQYYGLPFRRYFNVRKQNLKDGLPVEKKTITSTAPQRQIDEDFNRSSLGGVFEGLLGNLGITPNEFAKPTNRLLGGIVNSPKPGPKTYSNDVLPGYRIIGGNAATSSGTPLVSKGRSGFEKPSFII